MTDSPSRLFERKAAPKTNKVECLGMTFESDDARRKHFLQRLREKLPELRKRPDFPKGEDENILRMSDPPYYTACPNPFLAEFVERYGTPYDPAEEYHREPFAVDVSVGKTDPLYRAHGYHTKVPHLAIVPSILHYTEPGDIVLDGFCGSGMTGVAAQWCGAAPEEYRRKLEKEWKDQGREPPKWGARQTVLGDLSPAATFIAANYNIPFDVDEFAEAAKQLLNDMEKEVGWMYETLHTDGKTKGRINYTVWSEVFSCPDCGGEVVFGREAMDARTKRVKKEFPCPGCGAVLTKRRLVRSSSARWDQVLERSVDEPKRVPVLINYQIGNDRHDKEPDSADLQLLERIATMEPLQGVPLDRMMHVPDGVTKWGDKWRAGSASFQHVHHLFLPRAARTLACLWGLVRQKDDQRLRNMLLFLAEQAIMTMSMLNRYRPSGFSQVNQYMPGVYYVSSQISECSLHYNLTNRVGRLSKAFNSPVPSRHGHVAITTGDCGVIPTASDSIDYIFTDPPFGDNLAYAELNFVNETFHRVVTNQAPEAIVSQVQHKRLDEYQVLMRNCFAEYARILKPGRWMTVVFHNSQNSVWNAIQESLSAAGLVVADVRTLDKKMGSYNQVVASGAVKQDLVISCYKPSRDLEARFKLTAESEDGVWEFVHNHLRNLPVFVARGDVAEIVAERLDYLLFDRMVAFHVQRGVIIPLSAAEFYEGLKQRFAARNGMYFLPEQAVEHDRKRLTVQRIEQLALLVIDEKSAIEWLRLQLKARPRTFSAIHPDFVRELGGWQRHEQLLELSTLLEQNFLCYDGEGEVPCQIHGYLSSNYKDARKRPKDDSTLRKRARDRWYVPDVNKATDLERLRERTLLREFQTYREPSLRRLTKFRLEAVRAGFRHAWGKGDYDTILDIARRVPDKVLREDLQLLMWYDQAKRRKEAEG